MAMYGRTPRHLRLPLVGDGVAGTRHNEAGRQNDGRKRDDSAGNLQHDNFSLFCALFDEY